MLQETSSAQRGRADLRHVPSQRRVVESSSSFNQLEMGLLKTRSMPSPVPLTVRHQLPMSPWRWISWVISISTERRARRVSSAEHVLPQDAGHYSNCAAS